MLGQGLSLELGLGPGLELGQGLGLELGLGLGLELGLGPGLELGLGLGLELGLGLGLELGLGLGLEPCPHSRPPHTGLISKSGYSPAEAEGKTEEELMAPARRNGAQYLYVGSLE